MNQADALQRLRQPGERKEHAGEQEQRRDDEPEDRIEVAAVLSVAAYAMIGALNASPVSTAAGTASNDERRPRHAERDEHGRERGGDRRAAAAPIHASSPSTRSTTRIGVAVIAS